MNIENRIRRAINFIESIVPCPLTDEQIEDITGEIVGVVLFSHMDSDDIGEVIKEIILPEIKKLPPEDYQ